MVDYIPKEDFIYASPEDDGAQVRINHTNCTAGTDTKRRLYVKCSDGNIIAFCHNCGLSGFYSNSFFNVTKHKENPKFGSKKSILFPEDYITDWEQWPTLARAWVRKSGITQEECTQYGIGYSREFGRVVLSIRDEDTGKLLCVQQRKIFPHDQGPKYLTEKVPGFKGVHLRKDYNIIVIVEDYLSAIRVRRFASAYCLLGTNLSDWSVFSNYKKVLVWLDNDIPAVKVRNVEIFNRLCLITACKTVSIETDPKNCDDYTIVSILEKE